MGSNGVGACRQPVVTLGMVRSVDSVDDDDASLDDVASLFDACAQVLVTNVSLHGVGFRSPQPVDRDHLYCIEIGVGPLQLASRMRIVRVRGRADGTYDIGAEFC